MAFEMKTYDARKVTTVIDNVIAQGFQDGDMVSFAKDSDYIEVVVDAQGQASAAVNNDNMGTITVNISASSPFNKKMMQLANSRKKFPISIKHDTERAWGSNAYVQKTPDGAFGKGTGSRSYTIKVLDYKHEFL